MHTITTNRVLTNLVMLLYCLFFTSVLFSFRAISSMTIGLIILFSVWHSKAATGKYLPSRPRLYIWALMGLWIMTLVAGWYTTNQHENNNHLRSQVALVMIPFMLLASEELLRQKKEELLRWFCLLTVLASVYTLSLSCYTYWQSGDSAALFYHSLVKPLRQHAVYFSFYVLVSLIFLVEKALKKEWMHGKLFHILLLLFLSMILFLLSSKIILFVYTSYLVAVLILSLKASSRPVIPVAVFITVLACTALVLSCSNRISSRFTEIWAGKMNFANKTSYHPSDYFNGLQFRLLQWRLVPQVLTEQNRWIQGTTPGDAQNQLDAKYISLNMYIGDTNRNDRGYLHYNTHNQFLQTLLQHGLTGLLILLTACGALLYEAIVKKERLALFVILTVLLFSCTESLLETQYGLVIFSFFPLLVLAGKRTEANLLTRLTD